MKDNDREPTLSALINVLRFDVETLNFAERLHHALDLNEVSKNLQQRRDYLARLFKINSQQACAWLNVQKRPSAKMMHRIAELLKVNYDWLWRESGKPVEIAHLASQLHSLPIYYLGRHSKYKMLFNSFQSKWLTYAEPVSGNSYAVHRIDDQFTPLFSCNTMLVIDPQPIPEVTDYVLAYQQSCGRFVCGHPAKIDNKTVIIPLNDSTPKVLMPDDNVLGVICSAETVFVPKQCK